jgi:protein arginine N-methyltransferase 3
LLLLLQDVYGFSMQPIADELAAAAAAREAQVIVRPVDPACLTTPPLQVHAMDLATMSPAQQDFTAHFTVSATSAQLTSSSREASVMPGEEPSSSSDQGSDATSTVEVAALVLWFDVEFSARFCKEHPVTLSTSPQSPVTHWAQALLPLASPVTLGPGQALSCRLSMARSRARHRYVRWWCFTCHVTSSSTITQQRSKAASPHCPHASRAACIMR